ncbi:hypothetical protein JQM68_08865 [Oscillibacter valericigenes]|uniref:hypothetical protein n=1 Tax=Oscillibacter valericigenes TaxID=351091 RepID=UPI001F1F7B8C|nr:hypothetical protein [Oscillibacter valericigenes]MCF2617310.1 hypothetical protein [Oscillibacter valericigenes]
MRKEPSELWWENITGPQQLVSAVEYAVQDGRSVILRHPGFLPWEGLLRDLTRVTDTVIIDRPVKKDEIIPNILEHFPRKYAINCPPVYKNQLEFIKSQHVFQERTVWLSVKSGVPADQIIRFISDYRGDDHRDYGAFILAVSEEASIPTVSETVKVIHYQDYVRASSLRLFTALLAEDTPRIPEHMAEYGAAVMASVCAPDPELIPELMEETDISRQMPDTVLRQLWQEGVLAERDVLPGHPYGLLANEKGFETRIWRAQLQTLFSVIEAERTDIVKAHYDDIREALHTPYWDKKEEEFRIIKDPVNHCVIDDPYDAEIGVLARMLTLYRDKEETKKLWYLPEPETRERIGFLRMCRNSLAHITPCSPDSVARLLEKSG